MLARFLYRPDEEVGAFLTLAPEMEGVPEAPAEEEPEEFLAFELSGETYAVPIAAVREILKVTDVTEVPRAAPGVVGLINVRGEMLPLYDVKLRLRLADAPVQVRSGRELPRETRVVLFMDPEGDAGVLVDRVLGVVKLALSRLESAPAFGAPRDAVAGLGRHEGRLYILLDLEQALS